MDKDRVKAETRLKAAVVDRLIAGKHVDADAVLISEMSIANWSRRADVVLANGHLWAFEIKSEVDSLARLPGQIDDFGRYFEKLTVVVAGKFEDRARDMLPDGVGLWVQYEDGKITERVRPRVGSLTKDAAITLMTASELRRLLSCNGHSGIEAATRAALEMMAVALPASDLASAARDAIKRRFRSRHRLFLERKNDVGTVGAIPTLLRRSNRPTAPKTAQDWQEITWSELTISSDNPLLVNAPAGPVLKRKI